MFNFFSHAVAYFTKIKVVHRLPGRLRIKVPGGDKIPKEWRNFDQYLIDAIKMLPGIQEVSFNYISGNVLLSYDEKVTSEKQVLEWLQKIWDVGLQNQSFIEKNIEQDLQKVIDVMTTTLKAEISKL